MAANAACLPEVATAQAGCEWPGLGRRQPAQLADGEIVLDQQITEPVPTAVLHRRPGRHPHPLPEHRLGSQPADPLAEVAKSAGRVGVPVVALPDQVEDAARRHGHHRGQLFLHRWPNVSCSPGCTPMSKLAAEPGPHEWRRSGRNRTVSTPRPHHRTFETPRLLSWRQAAVDGARARSARSWMSQTRRHTEQAGSAYGVPAEEKGQGEMDHVGGDLAERRPDPADPYGPDATGPVAGQADRREPHDGGRYGAFNRCLTALGGGRAGG